MGRRMDRYGSPGVLLVNVGHIYQNTTLRVLQLDRSLKAGSNE